jgi:hypothetical protein
MEGACKYAYTSIMKDCLVEFTNSAGRKIVGTVTKVEGSWITVFETPGSCYKLPKGAVKLVRNNEKP